MDELIIVGDVHGQIRQLRALLTEIGSSPRPLIFVGDYVNRGENSKAVVDCLLQVESNRKDVIFLCGNHDWALLQYVEFGAFDRLALLGGLETLGSYLPGSASGDLRGMLLRRMPRSHVQFFQRLRAYYEDDAVVCSHAGVPAGSPGERSFNELVLGSHPELFHPHPQAAKFNICGHYPQKDFRPYQKADVICLDTGCGTLPNGRLTALLFPEMLFVQVNALGRVEWLNGRPSCAIRVRPHKIASV
jgi:serine/threonine protein phosphatase 1